MHKTGGVTFRTGDVVVPLYDDTGALVNLQLINSDGLKRTLKGGQVKGACHVIEGKKQARKTPVDCGGLCDRTHRASPDRRNRHGGAVVREPPFSGEPCPSETPACQIVLAADRDLSGDGQNKAAAAADAYEGIVALPPVFGDWNDAFVQNGGEATRKAIYDAIRPPVQSPFDTMSEAEFTAMSASDKALRVHEHYGEALAVDANGQLLSRYEQGYGKSFSRPISNAT